MSVILRNSPHRYGVVALSLHWLIAVLIVGMLILGTVMVDLTPGSSLQFQLYQLHKSFGITILALSLARLGWRLANPAPPLPNDLQPWERFLARVTHVSFYVLMIGMPLTGWMVVSASVWNVPTVLFGTIHLPHLPILSTLENKKPVEDVLKEIHESAAWVVIALLVLHVAGALKHHLVLKDDVLTRMLPGRDLIRRSE
jgi:cytochrome b561